MELGRYLCEVRAGQYWRLEELKCFDEFLERRFPGSRRKAYYLMSIHDHLPPQARKQLKELGWAKGLDLAKLAKRDRQHFDCAIWLHKARQMPTEQFKQEVEKELTGKETEPWEIIYFKLYQSQIPVIERAIETAALMLGSDRSRGYCLEMICADFLAGANLDHGDPEMLVFSMTIFYKFLPQEQRQAFLEGWGTDIRAAQVSCFRELIRDNYLVDTVNYTIYNKIVVAGFRHKGLEEIYRTRARHAGSVRIISESACASCRSGENALDVDFEDYHYCWKSRKSRRT